MNRNDLSEVRRGYVREKDPTKLRRWVALLLEHADTQERELEQLRKYKPSVSLGTVSSQKGRDEAAPSEK